MGHKIFQNIDENSDLYIAANMAIEKRDAFIEDLVRCLKNTEATKELIDFKVKNIMQCNYDIKLIEDALAAVSVYKKNRT